MLAALEPFRIGIQPEGVPVGIVLRFVVPALGMAIGAVIADQAPRGLVDAILNATFGDYGLGRGGRFVQATGREEKDGKE
jgi:hypothetical protein